MTNDENPIEAYRSAMAAGTADDREYAKAISEQMIEVVKAFKAIKARLDSQRQPESTDVAVLLRLTREGPMRSSDLADRLCIDRSTLSRQLAGMVRAGLLKRQADQLDGRASLLVPTESGAARVHEWVEARARMFAPLIADWQAADRETFLRLLTQFATELTTNVEAIRAVASDLVSGDVLTRRNA